MAPLEFEPFNQIRRQWWDPWACSEPGPTFRRRYRDCKALPVAGWACTARAAGEQLLADVGLHSVPVGRQAHHWTRRAADRGLIAADALHFDMALQQCLLRASQDQQRADANRSIGVPPYLNPNRSPERIAESRR